MITKLVEADSQIFTALMVALTAAILAIGLGRQLYV
jgi:photosystem I reaction center subunit XII